MLVLVFGSMSLNAQIDLPNPFKKGKKIKVPKFGKVDNFIKNLGQKSPISTSFDDAVYEVDFLNFFEPSEDEYSALHLQPKAEPCGYTLKTGFYSMNAQSFCLRGYSHGPSRGDGHLYAPLKGKKSELIKDIISKYSNKPHIPQRNVQVLLWAIIAGADMNELGTNYSQTLNELFTFDELLVYQGTDMLKGYADINFSKLKQQALNSLSPEIKNLLNAETKIRELVYQNKTFQEIEKVAIISGVAPKEDMIREVTKGRWSFHPNGYFIRFFPNGYPQTRVDIYVPHEGEILFNNEGKAIGLSENYSSSKEVIYNPSEMTAMPANRSSQRIGITPLPVPPCGNNSNTSNSEIKNYWEEEAFKQLQNDVSQDIKNQNITCAYAKMYLKNPSRYKWAGLAALVSGKIGIEEKETRWKPNIIGLMTSIMAGNKAVYNDLYWQHLAFEKNGISEIEKLYCENSISQDEYSAWKKISMGNVWEGNRDLLLHEQRDVLQPTLYANHPYSWYLSDTWGGIILNWGNVLKSPVPNDDTEFTSGINQNIANFNQRWKWIENHILPKWKEFESNSANKPILMQSLKNVCPTID